METALLNYGADELETRDAIGRDLLSKSERAIAMSLLRQGRVESRKMRTRA